MTLEKVYKDRLNLKKNALYKKFINKY